MDLASKFLIAGVIIIVFSFFFGSYLEKRHKAEKTDEIIALMVIILWAAMMIGYRMGG